MRFRRSPFLAIVQSVIPTVVMAGLLACGSDPKGQAPAIVVQFDPNFPPPASLDTGAGTGIAAVVTNDNQNKGVIFTCTPDNPTGTCGTFPISEAGSGVPVCYFAPAQIPAQNPITVTATSVTDPTKSISATINIVSGPPGACP